ncbi:uncharacterized protein LOC134283559 [Saccostrea cucullata]|uniref:uncharacterized protein LOC134283559 n=1 Tax=Saccostrea cuccullata TaxID=36930 RepID=UPI002ED55CD8
MDVSDKNDVLNSSTAVYVAHLFEKSTEKSSNFLNNIWTKRTSKEKHKIKNENVDEVLNNNLKETEFFENDPLHPPDDSVSEPNHVQPSIDPNEMTLGKGESNSSHDFPKECDDFSDDEGDATDYFDSDDEYQLSCKRRLMSDADDEIVHGGFDRYSTSLTDGRYSQGVEQYMNIPVFLRSIRKFATDNNFELWNGKTDGSCMFRSIADQLMINGHFWHTADTLRHLAIEYLKEHPLQEDGCPIRSFLSSETWEEYLSRMSNPKEWSDHIMLKAVVDLLHLNAVVFNIYKDDVRHTEVKSSRKNFPFPTLTIYLGHLGEFHYVSLRPKKWEKLWPYRALLHRCLFYVDKSYPFKTPVEAFERFKSLSVIRNFEDPGFQELFLSLSLEGNSKNQRFGDLEKQEESERSINLENSYLSMFNSYCLDELKSEDTNDSLECLIEDPLFVDSLTGIPLQHIGFIIKNTFPKELIIEYSKNVAASRIESQMFQYIGVYATGDNVALKDLSRERNEYRFQCKFVAKDPSVVAVHFDKIITFKITSLGQSDTKSVLHADCSSTHPGYCWLRPLEAHPTITTKKVPELNGDLFLTRQELPAEITLPPDTRQCYVGFVCLIFPSVAEEWVQRKRKFNWPSPYIISKIQIGGTCTLIPKCHPASIHPDIEWKLDFSMAYSILFAEALSKFQIQGYYALKIIIQETTKFLARGLKNKHIVSVFLYACEDIPQQKWETNLAGCILYTLSLLIMFLKRKFFPHYFVSSNNIIDHFTDYELGSICVYIEAIRLFPTMAVSFVAERHGYIFSRNLNNNILNDCKVLSISRDISGIYQKTFLPTTFLIAKFFCRLGFYSLAFRLIQESYEETLNLPTMEADKTIGRKSFLEFFIEGLREFKQKSSRGILRQLFDINNKTDVFARCSNKSFKIVSELVPWPVDLKLAWMRIPKENTRDFSLLASFFYDLSFSQYEMENVSLATVAIDAAILCLSRAISDESIKTDEIEDPELRKDIMAQQESMKRNLKSRLFHFYIHVYDISLLDGCIYPIYNYMSAVEILSKEFPEMYGVVAKMFFWIRRGDKGREYQRKFDHYLSEKKMNIY